MSRNIHAHQRTTVFRLLLFVMFLVLAILTPPAGASSLRENPRLAQSDANQYVTVQVTIVSVEAHDFPDPDGGRADLYAAVDFGGLRIDNEADRELNDQTIEPDWRLSNNWRVDWLLNRVLKEIVIEIWDDDPDTGAGASPDELIDVDGVQDDARAERRLHLGFFARRLPDGSFTCTINGDVQGNCGQNLTSMGTLGNYATLTFRLDLIPAQFSGVTDVVVTIDRVKARDLLDNPGKDSAADFYAAVSVNGKRSDNRDLEESLRYQQRQEIFPHWLFLKNVPSGESGTDIIVQIFDRDPKHKDDAIDIDFVNPGNGLGRDLNLFLDLFSCQIIGDVDGACGGFDSEGRERKFAEIDFSITVIPIRSAGFNDPVSLTNVPATDEAIP